MITRKRYFIYIYIFFWQNGWNNSFHSKILKNEPYLLWACYWISLITDLDIGTTILYIHHMHEWDWIRHIIIKFNWVQHDSVLPDPLFPDNTCVYMYIVTHAFVNIIYEKLSIL